MKHKAEVFETVLDISYTTRVVLGKHDVTLITELLPKDKNAPKIISFSINGYEKDRVVYKVRKDFTEDIDVKDATQLQRVIDTIHKEALNDIKNGSGIRKEPNEYLQAIKGAVGRKDLTKALSIAHEACDMHPDDPMVLTYFGYLTAIVEKKFNTAITACEKAVNLMPRKMPAGLSSTHKPQLFFHLTRVYQAAGKRREAVQAIYRGINHDLEGGPLHRELERLGVRRKPVIPFIGRQHFLNRVLGKIRHKIMGPPKSGYLEDEP